MHHVSSLDMTHKRSYENPKEAAGHIKSFVAFDRKQVKFSEKTIPMTMEPKMDNMMNGNSMMKDDSMKMSEPMMNGNSMKSNEMMNSDSMKMSEPMMDNSMKSDSMKMSEPMMKSDEMMKSDGTMKSGGMKSEGM